MKQLSRKLLVTKGLLLVAVIVALYHTVLAELVQRWMEDPDYSHGFFVPLVSAFLVWSRRDALARVPDTPSGWGAVLLGISMVMLIAGTLAAEFFVQRTSLIVLLAGLVLLLWGREHLKILAFPLAFLIFMVPVPAIVMNSITLPLQMFAAKTASHCLIQLGVPVLREGNVILLSSATLEVEEACSGIRSLHTLLAMGTILAYFTMASTWKRVVLVLLAIPIAIALNAFRVSGTGVLAHYWSTEVADGFYHGFSSFLVFVMALALLLGAAFLFSRRPNENQKSRQPVGTTTAGEPS